MRAVPQKDVLSPASAAAVEHLGRARVLLGQPCALGAQGDQTNQVPMNQSKLLKNLLISAAAALGLAAFARADVPFDEKEPLQSTTPVGQGLLGQQYASLTYTYIDR